MRLSVRLNRRGDDFTLELLPAQRVAVAAAVEVVSTLQVSESVLEIQFGAPRQRLIDIGERVCSSEEPLAVTVGDLQAVYRLLRTLPECFASEEAFHIRTGYYRENFSGLSKGLVDAVARIT